MFKRMANGMSVFVRKFLPDAFVIAIVLTLLTVILGIVVTGHSLFEMIGFWGGGFWNFLAFSMQMALVLVTGMVLADIPIIHRLLKKIASFAKTPTQAYVLTFLVSAVAYYINWGLAVVVGAIFSRAMYKNMPTLHFPLLIASAYVATSTFPGGLSSSIALLIATKGHFMEETIGIIPTSQTLFHYSNLLILLGQIITISLVIKFMTPTQDEIIKTNIEIAAAEAIEEKVEIVTPAQRLENSFILALLMGIVGLTYVINHFAKGGGLDLNIINLTFLSLGILFHRSPAKLVEAFKKAGNVVSPIMLQFPFYAGIMAMLVGSGLGAMMANLFTSFATAKTFPVFTYWAAGLVNILAPSAGGQWAIQAPISVPAGLQLGVHPAVTAMAVAWGDSWTNTIQPFWALPILAMAGLNIRDIMGYCIVIGLWIGVVTSVIMLLVY